MMQALEGKLCEECLRSLGLFDLEKGRLRRDLPHCGLQRAHEGQ